MKSNYAPIKALTHETVEDLNGRILSGNFSPAELAEWLSGQGIDINKAIIELHAKDVKKGAGLSCVLHHRQLNGTSGLSTDAIHQELGDLGQLLKLIPERIKQLEASLKTRAKDTHEPPPSKPVPPYADLQTDKKS